MKISKDAQRFARQMLRFSLVNGKLDESRVRAVTAKVIQTKPRAYLQVLTAYTKLIRLETEKRHAVIESATELQTSTRATVQNELRAKCGSDLTFDFVINPDLLGGMRVKVGSDVWDGSIKARLQLLKDAFR
jgi:F-type H+-transporting ATPase subunit delta